MEEYNNRENDGSIRVLLEAKEEQLRTEKLNKAGIKNISASLDKDVEELLDSLGYNREEKEEFMQKLEEANKNNKENNIDGNRETSVEEKDGPEM